MDPDADRKIREKIEKTIGVLDELETIEANPFLYTRVRARLASQAGRSRFGFVQILASPRIAVIVAMVAVNLVSAVFFLSKHSPTVESHESLFVSLTDDYYLSVDDDMFSNASGRE